MMLSTRRSVSPRGSTLVFFKAPGSEEEIEICHYPASGPVTMGPDITHLAFEVDDLEAFAKHSASKGYPLSDGPTPTSTGSVIAFVEVKARVDLDQALATPYRGCLHADRIRV